MKYNQTGSANFKPRTTGPLTTSNLEVRVPDLKFHSDHKLVVLLVVLGRVVQKPVNINLGLNVNCNIMFPYLKMVSISNVWCSLRLLQLKTKGQTI